MRNGPPASYSSTLLVFTSILAIIVLGGCSTHSADRPDSVAADSVTAVPCNTISLTCTISDSRWQHIYDRHCGGCVAGDKGAFAAGYCASKDAAVGFCNEVIGSPNCTMVVQADHNNNIAASATLDPDVGQDKDDGCNLTKRGTVIFYSGGQSVVTQFPGNP